MTNMAYLSLPGGTEWLCTGAFLALIVGFVFVLVYVIKKATYLPPHAPRICQLCHRGNLADARFCSYCGRELNQPPGAENR